MLPAEVDAAAEPAWSLHQPTHGGEPGRARPLQALVLAVREAMPIGIDERGGRRRSREALADPVAHLLDNEPPIPLVEDRVGEPGQHLEALDRGGGAIDKLALRPFLHDPVRARGEHEQRHVYGARVVQQPRRGIVQVEEHVNRDLPKDKRVGAYSARPVVGRG